MSIAPRLKLLTVCVGVALAQMVATPAMADSGKGVDTVLGNARNNTYPSGKKDPDAPPALHTPTGQLYNVPSLVPEPGLTTEGGWVVSGEIEAGMLRSQAKNKNAIYDMYRANSNGFYLNNFGLRAEKADAARYFEVNGGSVGQKDQFYGMTVGRYNDWKVKAFYNETPHVFTTTYRSLWDGVGTGNLTLKSGLTAGGPVGTTPGAAPGITANDVNSIVAVANGNASTELSITRKKGGVRLDMNVLEGVKFIASYSNEKRQGSRAFGMVAGIGGGGGQATPFFEVPESIDYNTHDFLTSLQYAEGLNSLNVNVTASIFKNNIGTETIEIPFGNSAIATDGMAAKGIKLGRFDLVPDNKAYNASAEYERLLPDLWNGHFTATVSTGTSRQDDALIAPSANAVPGGGTSIFTINSGAGGWNTTDALYQKSAKAKINNTLIDLALVMKPTDTLDVKAKVRQYETKNSTRYLACNPNAQYVDNTPGTAAVTPGGVNAFGCNGVWGRILNDGAAVSLFTPATAFVAPTATTAGAGPGTNFYIQSTPYDSKQTNAALSADYKLGKFSSLNAALEREDVKRRFRERETTNENKIKLGYVNNGIENATVRVSFEQDNRTGSQYSSTQYRTTQMSGALYPALGLTTFPAAAYQTTAYYETRRIDVSDRKQKILNARFNYMVTPELDAGITGQVKRVEYPDAVLGASKRDQNSFNMDATYQASTDLVISGFVSRQVGKYDMASATIGIAAGVAAAAPNPAGWPGTCTDLNNPGGCATPYNRLGKFSIFTADTNTVVGVDAAYDFGIAQLKAAVTGSRGVTKTSYTSWGSLASAQTGPNTGTGMPDMLFNQKTLDLNLLVPHTTKLSTRLLYHFEAGTVTDWHYSSVQATPSASLTAAGVTDGFVLDRGPQSYHVHSFGAFLNYKL